MYNKHCCSVVILIYPEWGGGKFLSSCLGLSNNAYLQHRDLIKKQLDGNLSTIDKFTILNNNLIANTSNGAWNDFRLGWRQTYYGDDTTVDYSQISEEIKIISNGFNFFFFSAANLDAYNQLINSWPNAKKIFLTDLDKFVHWRLGDAAHKFKPFSQEHNEFFLNIPNMIVWSADNFLEKNKFVGNLRLLYAKLNLSDFDPKLISSLHQNYVSTLDKLRNT